MNFLWPAFKKQACDMDHAKAGFCWHVMRDHAWYEDYTEDQLIEFIDGLN